VDRGSKTFPKLDLPRSPTLQPPPSFDVVLIELEGLPSNSATAEQEAAPDAEEDSVLQEILHEARSFVSEGQLDQAHEIVKEALLIYPDNAVLLRIVQQWATASLEITDAAAARAAQPGDGDEHRLEEIVAAAEEAPTAEAAPPLTPQPTIRELVAQHRHAAQLECALDLVRNALRLATNLFAGEDATPADLERLMAMLAEEACRRTPAPRPSGIWTHVSSPSDSASGETASE
jgi:hypothetical protein